jgi:hypothetical protein
MDDWKKFELKRSGKEFTFWLVGENFFMDVPPV